MGSTSSRLLIIAAAVVWSTGGAAVKLADAPALQIAGGRAFFAALALLLYAPARKLPSKRTLITGLFYATTCTLFVFANTLTTAANTIFLQNIAPIWVLVLSPWFLKETSSRREFWSVPVSIVGSALFFVDDLSPGRLAGNLCALGASLSYALLIMSYRKLPSEEGLAATVHGNFMIVIVAVPAFLSGPAITTNDLAAFSYLGVVQQAGGALLFVAGIRGVSAMEGALLTLFEPLLTPVWAYLTVNEKLGPWAWFGAALIFAATVWRSLPGRKRAPGVRR